jgi:type II secretory pathway pseudopilin PulG
MVGKRNKFRSGFTLIELIITVVAAIILLLGITGILASGIKNFKTMYERVTSDVIRNAYEARSIFDLIVRKSSIKRCDLSNPRNNAYDQVIVYYYSDPTNLGIVEPNRYAQFYRNGSDLILVQGDVRAGTFSTLPVLENPGPSIPIAHNVSSAAGVPGIFSCDGNSVQMVLTLDDESPPNTPDNKLKTLSMTITSTALRHNI